MKKNNFIRSISTFMQLSFYCVASLCAMSAAASIVVVTPASTNWGTTDANSAITSSEARSGNGSLELHGDRTRFFGLGNPFDASSNIGMLSNLSDFSFEWMISSSSINPYHADYTPALRLHIFDSGVRSELIWEGAYNGVYGNIAKDNWYQSQFDDYFYKWTAGVGVTEIYNRTITNWQSEYSQSAYISAVSIGVGSGASANYLAYADNLTLEFGNERAVTFNFETASQVSAPGSAGLAALALLLLGVSVRRSARRG